jgi:acetyl esterase/lipase
MCRIRDSSVQGPNHLAVDHSADGVWIDPVSDDLLVGDMKQWAEINNVKPMRIPGYWLLGKTTSTERSPSKSKPSSTSTQRGRGKVILFFHGGAYISRSAHPSDSIANITRALIDAGSPHIKVALSIEYRLSSGAPFPAANPFPAAILDALSGYVYLLKLGYLPEDIIVAGDSAGGNLALALTRYIIELGTKGVTTSASDNSRTALRSPGALLLLSPWVDLGAGLRPPLIGSSFIQNLTSDFVGGPHSQSELYATHAYAGNLGPSSLRANAYISPASPEIAEVNFKGFPRACIVSGDAEVGLDAIRVLKDRMVADLGKGGRGGDGVVYHEFVDAFHDFVGFEWFEPQRTQALKEVAAWFDRVLK